MKVIHQGTIVQAHFGILDDDGNVVQNITINPDPNTEQDPLNIKVLSEDNFKVAYGALMQIRQKIIQDVDPPILPSMSE